MAPVSSHAKPFQLTTLLPATTNTPFMVTCIFPEAPKAEATLHGIYDQSYLKCTKAPLRSQARRNAGAEVYLPSLSKLVHIQQNQREESTFLQPHFLPRSISVCFFSLKKWIWQDGLLFPQRTLNFATVLHAKSKGDLVSRAQKDL